jgi:carbon storage regulator
MLVLTRKPMEEIFIGDDIRIVVLNAEQGRVRIGIDAPDGVVILRDDCKSSERKRAARRAGQK